jgi:hypothetical protein
MKAHIKTARTGFPEHLIHVPRLLPPIGLQQAASSQCGSAGSSLTQSRRPLESQICAWGAPEGWEISYVIASTPSTGHGLWSQQEWVSPDVAVIRVSDAVESETESLCVPGSSRIVSVSNPISEYAPHVEARTYLIVNTVASCVTNKPSFDPQPAPDIRLPDTLKTEIDEALALAVHVEFEDGFENKFTLRVMDLVKKYGNVAVEELARKLFRPELRPHIAAQTLLCLGRMDDRASYSMRSWVIRQGLRSSSAKVRDAAAVAIDSMYDISAQADLAKAIEREPVPTLKEDMQSVLESLRATK